MKIQFKKFSSEATEPFLATEGSGCYDLCSAGDYEISPSSVQFTETSIGVAIPRGFIGKIFTRSSWALKFTSVEGGVIDSDYRGSIKIIFHNKSSNCFHVKTGQFIAQIGFFRSEIVDFVEVSNFEKNTLRGEKDFGSTNDGVLHK